MNSLLLPIGALIAQSGWLRIAGINPNIILVLAVVMARYMKNIWAYWVAVAVSVALVKSMPGFEWESVCIIAIACSSIVWSRYEPFHPLLGTIILIIVMTVGWHAALVPELIVLKPMLVIGEVIYNMMFGVIAYGVMEMWYGART
jgi:hypothetical protein